MSTPEERRTVADVAEAQKWPEDADVSGLILALRESESIGDAWRRAGARVGKGACACGGPKGSRACYCSPRTKRARRLP